MNALPVVVIGAGPVGLAAGAHLRDRGLPAVVLEAGDAVGAAVRKWGHIRTFTPWQWIVDPVAEGLLEPTGWTRPATPAPPTGDELVAGYLDPLAGALGDAVRTGARVMSVTRDGADFVVRLATGEELRGSAVIDASGTWSGQNGLGARGEDEAETFLVGPLPDVLGIDRTRFAGRRTLVVGAGHSAANTLLALGELARQEPGTEVVWAVRGGSPERVLGGGEADQLEARGRLGNDLEQLVRSGAVQLHTGVTIDELVVTGETVEARAGQRRIGGLHGVVAATGFSPDLSMLAGLDLDLDPYVQAPSRLAPLVDPRFHSCGTVRPHGHRELAHPEPGFYVVGMKAYGRAPTFLITTGNEQVRSVVAALAGDLEAADAVELVLPATGVCSTGPAGEELAVGCCVA